VFRSPHIKSTTDITACLQPQNEVSVNSENGRNAIVGLNYLSSVLYHVVAMGSTSVWVDVDCERAWKNKSEYLELQIGFRQEFFTFKSNAKALQKKSFAGHPSH